METKRTEKKTYDISTLSRLMKKDFIFVIAVFLALVLIFTDISIYESFGSVRSRKLEAENLAVICVSEIERNSEDGQLSFLSENVNLLQVEGNDSNSWGTAGSNGGTVTFTAYGETLSGDVSVDTISALDFYLLDGTTYTGAFTITENAVNTNATDSPITVNVSSDSTWVVTEDTTVSALNAEDGATIVDESGKTVTIVANGETVVSGDSSITVTVSGDYSTTVTTDENNELSDSYIDRTSFDDYYGTSTGFTTLAATVSSTESDDTSSDDTAVTSSVSTGILAGILALVLVAFTGIFVVLKKKRK